MRRVAISCFGLLFLTLFSGSAVMAQSQGLASAQSVLKQPEVVDSESFFEEMGAHVKFARTNKMSQDAKAGLAQQRVVSVPNWSSSFTFQGQVFPYTMVGRNPRRGDSTEVDTSLIALSFFFDEFVDSSGNNIVFDVTPDVPNVVNSPDFLDAPYGTGFTQFGDAIQRAEFFHVMERDWHTRVERPRMLTPVQIEVPVGAAHVFQSRRTGTLFALMDINFFISQLNTIIQLENIKVTELSLMVSPNTLLFENGDMTQCCVLGFHTAFETKAVGNTHFVQTLAWASWLDPGIFRDPEVADVLPFSHEVSEWLNDPFINNATPAWQFPDGSGACQANLETGDPVEVLPHESIPVTLHGFVYHPQTEALLQWFSRETPSSAIDGAYSYPDEAALPTASQACAHP